MTPIIINRFRQKVASVLLILICFETFFPVQALALTSGPSQPEFKDFEPAGTSNMVDPFSGDFSYNIPLFELPGPDGGYPFNLSYHSGITMDQEASWVGLGWSLNHGAITRNMRGLPDEFAGDVVTREVDMKPDITWAITPSYRKEILGIDQEKLEEARKKLKEAVKSSDPAAIAKAQADYVEILNVTRGKKNVFKPTITFNNHQGIGLKIGRSFPVPLGSNSKLNLNADISSTDGANLNPSFSAGDRLKYGVSLDMNSREGFRDLSLTLNYKLKPDYWNMGKQPMGLTNGLGGTSTFSYAKQAYSPKVDLAFKGMNFSLDAEVGKGAYTNKGVKVDVQYFRNALAKKEYKSPAYGFFNMKLRPSNGDNNNDKNALLDFNREKDSPLRKTTTNLATPNTTPDIYTVMGQGVGGSFMAQRSDIGILTDPYMKSSNFGGGLGVEFNIKGLTNEIGINVKGVKWSNSRSKKWKIDATDGLSEYEFKDKDGDVSYEPYYMKSAGEMTAEPISSNGSYGDIGDDNATFLKLEDKSNWSPFKSARNFDKTNTALKSKDGKEYPITSSKGKRASRKPRASSIQFITNEDLLRGGGELLNEFKVEYYSIPDNQYDCNSSKGKTVLKRDAKSFSKHHAGIVALQPNGMRYNFALPVVNFKQEDFTFSYGKADKNAKQVPVITKTEQVNNVSKTKVNYKVSESSYGSSIGQDLSVSTSDDFFDKNTLPQYNHSYLLTSILGTDYIDADNIPGPSDGDYGYWVKFNYVKTSGKDNPYKWREPFIQANFIRGHRSVDKDNKAAFAYGEREQYYLATAETKTHVAKFIVLPRKDGRGANNVFQNEFNAPDNNKGNRSYKLDKIELYSKLDETKPIQVVNLTYNYKLCPTVKNSKPFNIDETDAITENVIGGEGKLTLKEVFFTYENNIRGRTTPYKFDYKENSTSSDPGGSLNPSYDNFQYDRWGNFKALGSNNGENLDFPYTYQNRNQVNEDDNNKDWLNKTTDDYNKDNRNKWASVWNLREITMPSGAKVVVDYESDDYAYVQDRVAMKMFKIRGLGSNPNAGLDSEGIPIQINTDADYDEKRIIMFNFDKPSGNTLEDLKNYVSDLHNIRKYTIENNKLFFADGERPQIYFKVLMTLQKVGTDSKEYIQGYANVEEAGIINNEIGYIKLEPVKMGSKDGVHPFTAAAWQTMKTEYPDRIKGGYAVGDVDKKDGWNAFGKLLSSFGEILTFFKSLNKSCYDRQYGRVIDLDKSVIRLNCPDKIKYGGGSRVQKITLQDQWNQTTPTYGNVYDYTTVENGKTISSGVATNEPTIGYDECALRYAKFFKDKKKIMGIAFGSSENLIYEYPINEAYMPGASIGYSKVTVRSLASDVAAKNTTFVGDKGDVSSTFGTTGSVVNEFYTAKDFPILFDETVLNDETRSTSAVPIPLFVINYYPEKYTASQGYAITLNDMHGKARSVTSYNQSGARITQAIFKYKEGDKTIKSISGKDSKRTLDNKVDVILSSRKDIADIATQELGVDREFFMDMREMEESSYSVAIGLNIFIPPGSFTVVPQIDITEKWTRTAATNKIIRRSGILIQVDNYDGLSHLTTSNKVFDPLTGEPVLTTVNNSFDKPIYSFQSPARFDYASMGAAYENWGMRFKIDDKDISKTGDFYTAKKIPQSTFDKLSEGDEFIVKASDGTKTKATLLAKETPSSCRFIFETDISLFGLEFWLWRSGKRNQVGVAAGNVVALNDPTKGRVKTPVTMTIKNPSGAADNVTFDYYKIDKVLNAGATTFSEAWHLSGMENTAEKNPYKTGERGIWRPYQSYVFVKDRNIENIANINLANDGYYNDFPLFDFKNPFFYKKEYGLETSVQNSINKWRVTSEITQYGKNGSEIETKDILGKYSSVLYGYKDNLEIAVAGNAQQNEIGFEGFEEFRSNQVPRNGNLDFSSNNYIVSESYSVIGGCKKSGNLIDVWVDKPATAYMRRPSTVTLNLTDQNGNISVIKDAAVTNMVLDINAPKIFNDVKLTKLTLSTNDALVGNVFAGRVSLKYNNSIVNPTVAQVDFNNAHTGRASLKVGTTPVSFNQGGINFQHGKTYYLSAWVKVLDAMGKPIQAYTYGTTPLITAYFKNNATLDIATCKPVGEIIEGWQKVEGTISPDLTNVLSANPKAEWVLKLDGATYGAYFDDIRIFPKDAEMQTYVYDPRDYKLRATLDNNNFATLYLYDESGTLVLLKKETAKGIKTIQETKSYVGKLNGIGGGGGGGGGGEASIKPIHKTKSYTKR